MFNDEKNSYTITTITGRKTLDIFLFLVLLALAVATSPRLAVYYQALQVMKEVYSFRGSP